MTKNKKNWQKYYNELFPLIVGTLLSKIGNIHDAEDLAQDVFIDFFNKSHCIKKPEKWVFGAMRVKLFEYYRKRNKVKHELEIDTILNNMPLKDSNTTGEIHIIIDSILEDIHNEQEKNIFDFIVYQQYTFKEVADITGLSRRQVEYKYKCLAKKILDQLKKKGIYTINDIL